MTEILFYHLTESRLEDALPALLEKSLARGWKVVVETAGEPARDALDAHLWVYRDDSFLPHGTDQAPHGERQPIFLTAGADNPNGADVRFLTGGVPVGDVQAYQRVVLMFDGHDEDQLQGARKQWKALKEQDHALTYWQQGSDGRWERKA